jgi:hypothetical protein
MLQIRRYTILILDTKPKLSNNMALYRSALKGFLYVNLVDNIEELFNSN